MVETIGKWAANMQWWPSSSFLAPFMVRVQGSTHRDWWSFPALGMYSDWGWQPRNGEFPRVIKKDSCQWHVFFTWFSMIKPFSIHILYFLVKPFPSPHFCYFNPAYHHKTIEIPEIKPFFQPQKWPAKSCQIMPNHHESHVMSYCQYSWLITINRV